VHREAVREEDKEAVLCCAILKESRVLGCVCKCKEDGYEVSEGAVLSSAVPEENRVVECACIRREVERNLDGSTVLYCP
jgi:hypothetical protein